MSPSSTKYDTPVNYPIPDNQGLYMEKLIILLCFCNITDNNENKNLIK